MVSALDVAAGDGPGSGPWTPETLGGLITGGIAANRGLQLPSHHDLHLEDQVGQFGPRHWRD